MKKIILSVALIAASFTTVAQVGIGTTTPINALDVYFSNTLADGIRIENADAASASGTPRLLLGMGGSGNTVAGWHNTGIVESAADGGLVIGAYTTNTQIKFQVNTRSVEAMLIDPKGVGIGVPFGTAPTSKLQVVGLPVHVDNAAAIAAGLTAGAFYHTAGVVKVVF